MAKKSKKAGRQASGDVSNPSGRSEEQSKVLFLEETTRKLVDRHRLDPNRVRRALEKILACVQSQRPLSAPIDWQKLKEAIVDDLFAYYPSATDALSIIERAAASNVFSDLYDRLDGGRLAADCDRSKNQWLDEIPRSRLV
jgi:hypothetical protein